MNGVENNVQSIPWYSRVDLARPGIDPPRQAANIVKPRPYQNLPSSERTLTVMAMRYDFGVTWQLGQPVGELAQRNQPRPVDVCDLGFAWLANVEQQEIRFVRAFTLKIPRRDFDPVS